MRKLIAAIFLFGGFGIAWATTTQPQFIGTVQAVIESKTTAAVGTTTPKRAGQLLYCSDCTTSRLCISSGTVQGAWVVGIATGPFTAGTYPHCQ